MYKNDNIRENQNVQCIYVKDFYLCKRCGLFACLFSNEDLVLVFTIKGGQTAHSLVLHRDKLLSFGEFSVTIFSIPHDNILLCNVA